MYWKRGLTLFSLTTIIALMLAACGVSTTPQGGNNGSTDAPPAPQTGDNAQPSGDVTAIRWRTRPSDAAEQQVYEELNALVNEQLAAQGIQASYDPGVNQGYFEKLKTELASGNAPDIFWIGAVELADFVNTGEILDLKPYIDQDSDFELSAFYDSVMAELTRDGKIYGLPRDISTMVTYYNADMFAEAGLPTPKELSEQGNWNWETMLDNARQLTDPTDQRYGVGFGNWWGPSWGYFVNAAGGSPFNADRTACALNTPEAIGGARFVQNLYNEQLLPLGDQDGEALFNAGKVGMYFNGRWFAPGIRTNAQFNWDVAEMPMGQVESTWLFWGPYLVNARTENPEAAWEVLKLLTGVEATAQIAALGTNVPPRQDQAAVDAFLGATPPENNQAYLDGIAYAALEAPVWDGNWADFNNRVQSLWDEMIAGLITPEEFGERACEQTAETFTN
ncbi:MAG: sugar ABC transporter substrate-binding protein [Chloroflexales bacterium]|nr:sugar ABC transporter substrate-binding protein [Chloroflexales bacterium]